MVLGVLLQWITRLVFVSASQVGLGEEICRQVLCLAVDILASRPLCTLTPLFVVGTLPKSSSRRKVIVQLLLDILPHDQLKVSSEDEVHELVMKVAGEGGDDADAEKLWATVRLPQLSAKCLMHVANVKSISKLQLAWAVACRGHWAAPVRPVPEGVCFQGPRKSCIVFNFCWQIHCLITKG